MAWEMGNRTKPEEGVLFRGVSCRWDGARRRSVIPWGNVRSYNSVVGVIKSTKSGKMDAKFDVDVTCIVG